MRNIFHLIMFTLSLFISTPMHYIDSDLIPYTNYAYNLVNYYCPSKKYFNPNQTMIYFSILKDNQIGLCSINPYRFTIQIDPKYWLKASKSNKYEIIMHEMSHCLLFKEHSDNYKNYMYYEINDLSIGVTTEQFVKDIKEHCKEK